MKRRTLLASWTMGAGLRHRTKLVAAIVGASALAWSTAAGAAALPAEPHAVPPAEASAKNATPDPMPTLKPQESGGPGESRQVQPLDRRVVPVSRSSSSDSAVTYSSDGQTTVAALSGDVTFDVDSSALTDRAKQVLDDIIVNRWKGKPPATVTVVGHTDSVADDAHNQTLSEQRAKAVADYLTSKVPSLNVQSSGKGESEPVASETNADGSVNEAGKAANRHVDVRWG